MNRHIWLRDLDHIPIVIDGVYSKYNFTAEEIATARAKLAKRGLRFDNLTGHTRDNSGLLAEFRRYMTGTLEQMEHPTKWVPHTSLEDVLKWEFRGTILNDANRTRLERVA